jgi:hypothetical protein
MDAGDDLNDAREIVLVLVVVLVLDLLGLGQGCRSETQLPLVHQSSDEMMWSRFCGHRARKLCP